MRACWDEKPEARPSFTELRKMMKEMGDEKEVTPTQKNIFPFTKVDIIKYCFHLII